MPDATPNFYSRYTSLVPDADLVAELDGQRTTFLTAMGGVREEESGRPHPPYTWTIRQVVGHLLDAERIFGYRAMRIARGDETPLPGFDENAYAVAGEFDGRAMTDLLAEFDAVRRSHVLLFRHLPAAAWERTGVVNGTRLSVLDLARVLVGHVRHHAAIVEKRLAGRS
ncbi:DinB family protein [Limnoglobus roseus]|uniref:DinB family protein n=1 Tax=Limnoglobus roseus TaxID=2598579 RepID=A0A5C1ANE0_9BACT|nr:DinB family protein [Limnoglobus roseus]QEL19633.1 DinB family protein [Limnoglobus roseus]